MLVSSLVSVVASVCLTAGATSPKPVLTLGASPMFAVEAPVEDVAFSPDGRDLAALVHLGSHVSVDVYDTTTGARRYRVGTLPTNSRGRVVFTPRSDRLVALVHGRVAVWDARSGRRLHDHRLPRKWHHAVWRAVVSPDGRRVELVPFNKTTSAFVDLDSGQVTPGPTSSPVRAPWPRLVARTNGWRVVGFAAGGGYAVAASEDAREIHVFDRSGKRLHRISSAQPVVRTTWAVDIRRDGRQIALTGRDRLHVVTLPQQRWVTAPEHVERPHRIALSGNGRRLAVADESRGVKVFDRQGHVLAAFPQRRNVHFVALDASGATLVVQDQFARAFDVASGRQLWQFDDSAAQFAVSGDRSTLALARGRGRGRVELQVMALGRAQPTPWVRHTLDERGWNSDLALSHSGRRLAATFGRTQHTWVFDVEGQALRLRNKLRFKGRGSVFRARILGDTDQLVATSPFATRAWVVPILGKKWAALARTGGIASFAEAAGPQRVVLGDESGQVQLWNTATRTLEASWSHAPGIAGLTTSSDGRWVATLGKDQQVRLWDMGERP